MTERPRARCTQVSGGRWDVWIGNAYISTEAVNLYAESLRDRINLALDQAEQWKEEQLACTPKPEAQIQGIYDPPEPNPNAPYKHDADNDPRDEAKRRRRRYEALAGMLEEWSQDPTDFDGEVEPLIEAALRQAKPEAHTNPQQLINAITAECHDAPAGDERGDAKKMDDALNRILKLAEQLHEMLVGKETDQ